MNQPVSPRHPWKAIAAIVAMLAAVHGVHASTGTPEPEPSHVHIVGQLPLHQACPEVDDDLQDALAAAWDDVAKPSAVTVTFKVQRHAVFDVAPAADSPYLYHQIRRAVHGLRCDSGDDQEHTVRLVVRFVDAEDSSRVAITDVVLDDQAQD
jgi:hypothetical protein